jgi:hypothetical protein
MTDIDVKASELYSTLTLRIKGLAMAKLRIRLCARIIRFAAWVGGVTVVIED